MERVKIEHTIKGIITSKKQGEVYFANDFRDVGMLDSVNRALSRLAEKNIIIRLAHGIYYYPKFYEGILIRPSAEDVAEEIAKRDKAKILPTGIEAQNLIGISTQVVVNAVFLTNGTPRVIKVGKRTIRLIWTTPKNMSMKGQISQLVIEALRDLKERNLTEKILKQIAYVLKKEKKENILHDAELAPVWISKIMLSLI